MKKYNLITCLLLFPFVSLFSQHYSLYSQYMFNGLVINPAYAGSSGAIDVTASHRRQWSGLSGSPTTSAITLHSPVKGEKVCLGLSISDDRFGATMHQNVNAVYSYKLKIGETSSLSLGVQGGLEFARANWDKLIRNDADDDLLLSSNPGSMNFTSGAGIYFQSKKIVGGISSPYILNTSSGRSFLAGPVLLYGGYNFFLKDSSSIRPSILFRGIKGSPAQIDINVMCLWKQKYGIGVSYRNKESFVAMFELNFKKQFRLCYSYDYGIGPIKLLHSGSHEVTFRYLISKNKPEIKEDKGQEEKK
ncbi:MAG: type IX secretion system membrane protein PorP/SprF [Bacteroidota bacterium]|jgi:type IX secretion system PorP/SprF family membrane protein